MRRGGVTVAVSTDGRAPALAGLLREALEAVIPDDVGGWVDGGEPHPRAQQKAAACPWASAGRCCFEALNRLYAEPRTAQVLGMTGFVSLVGAGPGDPDLLTVRAARTLAAADIVFYDALVSRGDAGPRPARPAVLRGQARGPAVDAAGDDPRAADPRRAPRQARRAAQGRRSVRVRPRRRGGARPRAPRESRSRWCPGVSSAARRAGARRHPGHPSRPGLGVRRGLGSRRERVAAGARGPARRAVATIVVADGPSRSRARSPRELLARGWPPRPPRPSSGAPRRPAPRRWVGTLAELGAAASPRTRRAACRARSSSARSWSSAERLMRRVARAKTREPAAVQRRRQHAR